MKRNGKRLGILLRSRLPRLRLTGIGRKTRQRLKRAAAACLVLTAALGLLRPGSLGNLLKLAQGAAVLSAALAMPEAGVEQLRERVLQAVPVSSELAASSPWAEGPVWDGDRGTSWEKGEMDPPIAGTAAPDMPVPDESPLDTADGDTSGAPEPDMSAAGENPGEFSDESLEAFDSQMDYGQEDPPVYKIASSGLLNRYIPPENRGMILSQTFSALNSPIYIQYGQGSIKNSTDLSNSQAQEVLDTPWSLEVSDLSQPTVLIYHTHATEAYEPYDGEYFDKTYNWRSDDNDNNMVAVGTALARQLEQAGIGVVHITRQHDNPSYNGAYDKSAQTVREALEQYPTIQVILDIHRDAIQRDADTIVKAVSEIDGRKAAQLMIIAGCDDSGFLGMPQWRQNFRFSAALQDTLESIYPGLCRPVFFCYRKYNMDLCPNGALIEIGSHGNTLEEAQYAAELLGKGLAVLLRGQVSGG